MVFLGVLLCLLAIFVVTAKALFWLGVVLIVAGLVLNFGIPGPVDGSRRRRYY